MKSVYYEKVTKPLKFFLASDLSALPHLHKEAELVYVLKGHAFAHADRKIYELSAGDLFFSFPNQIHFYDRVSNGKYYVVVIDSDIIYNAKSSLCDFVPESNMITDAKKMKIGDILTNAYNASGEFITTLRIGFLNQAIGTIMPYFTLNPRIKTANSSLQNILTYCSRHFSESPSLDDIAEELHLSKCYVSHLLNDSLGFGLNYYLNMLRIDSACDMLEDTDQRISDISGDVGFGSIRSFNRAFFEIMKITPLEYRRKFREQSAEKSEQSQ